MPLETTPFDPAEVLDSPEAVVAYLEAAFEDGDPRLSTFFGVIKALGLRLEAKAA